VTVATVVLVGTLDTKGVEYGYLRDRIRRAGCDVVLVDAGVVGEPTIAPDVSRTEVAAAAGRDLAELVAAGDRGAAVAVMADGAAEILREMWASGSLHGACGMGGSGGSSLAGKALQALPVGVPKMLVSTMASSDVRAYVGGSDVTLMYSVVDISGLNRILERILDNAAAAIAGMAIGYASARVVESDKPVIGATMFGVTTDAVTTARRWLEDRGYEVLVFHATGAGGMSMEALMRSGHITGVLDVTTTELADEVVGGILSAGPDRLGTAGALGLPQVVSLGSLDIANFGPIDAVPERYRERNLYEHNPAITLMRTTPEECARIGEVMADKLNQATGPLTVFIPRRGISGIAVEGGIFWDPAADEALIGKLKANLDPSVDVVEMDTDINDPVFATAMAERLDEHYRAWASPRVSA
jgi:uncharacterized protein (UPF0261 family)